MLGIGAFKAITTGIQMLAKAQQLDFQGDFLKLGANLLKNAALDSFALAGGPAGLLAAQAARGALPQLGGQDQQGGLLDNLITKALTDYVEKQIDQFKQFFDEAKKLFEGQDGENWMDKVMQAITDNQAEEGQDPKNKKAKALAGGGGAAGGDGATGAGGATEPGATGDTGGDDFFDGLDMSNPFVALYAKIMSKMKDWLEEAAQLNFDNPQKDGAALFQLQVRIQSAQKALDAISNSFKAMTDAAGTATRNISS